MRTNLVVLSLFFIQCLIAASGNEQFIRFIPTVPIAEQRAYFQSPGPVSPIEVDATSPTQVRIQILEVIADKPVLKLHCRIAPLDGESQLTSAFLCHRKSLTSKQECADPKLQTPQFGAVKFDAVGNRSHGYSFSSELPVGSGLLDGFYYCKFRNQHGELSSNMVEIQDVLYYQKAEVAARAYKPIIHILPTLTKNSLPLQLECGRPGSTDTLHRRADPTLRSPFAWWFCDWTNSESSVFDCLRQVRTNPIRVSEYFTYVVLSNGTLILYERTSTPWRGLGLMCRSDLSTINMYAVYTGGSQGDEGPIQYNSTVPYADNAVHALSPTIQQVEVRSGSLDNLILVANYKANPSSASVEWTRDNEPIRDGLFQSTRYTLKFPNQLHRNHSGTYELQVRDQRESVRLRYNVKIAGPPEVISSPPPVILVMAGGEATFQCDIAEFATTSVLINGVEYFPDSRLSKLIERYPYLAKPKIHPLQVEGKTRLVYRASNLQFDAGSLFGSTHTVTIIAANAYGQAVVSCLINVLPLPKVIDSPAYYSCGPPCLSSEEHEFHCQFDLSPYRMAHVRQTWDFNGVDVTLLETQGPELANYLQRDDTNSLRLLTIPDPRDVESMFHNSSVTCRLRIFYPAVLSEATSSNGELTTFPDPKWIVYDSRKLPTMQSLLTSNFSLQPDARNPPAAANISWIAAVVIAVIIIFIIAILVACIVMRTRGETYLVDKEERALGNDPEKELRENAFRTYERAEEPPLRGSRCSLNDDSAEIGSDADGELDDYNLDPGKFNEEGSFIDQYVSETHYKGVSRLPSPSNQPYNPMV